MAASDDVPRPLIESCAKVGVQISPKIQWLAPAENGDPQRGVLVIESVKLPRHKSTRENNGDLAISELKDYVKQHEGLDLAAIPRVHGNGAAKEEAIANWLKVHKFRTPTEAEKKRGLAQPLVFSTEPSAERQNGGRRTRGVPRAVAAAGAAAGTGAEDRSGGDRPRLVAVAGADAPGSRSSADDRVSNRASDEVAAAGVAGPGGGAPQTAAPAIAQAAVPEARLAAAPREDPLDPYLEGFRPPDQLWLVRRSAELAPIAARLPDAVLKEAVAQGSAASLAKAPTFAKLAERWIRSDAGERAKMALAISAELKHRAQRERDAGNARGREGLEAGFNRFVEVPDHLRELFPPKHRAWLENGAAKLRRDSLRLVEKPELLQLQSEYGTVGEAFAPLERFPAGLAARAAAAGRELWDRKELEAVRSAGHGELLDAMHLEPGPSTRELAKVLRDDLGLRRADPILWHAAFVAERYETLSPAALALLSERRGDPLAELDREGARATYESEERQREHVRKGEWELASQEKKQQQGLWWGKCHPDYDWMRRKAQGAGVKLAILKAQEQQREQARDQGGQEPKQAVEESKVAQPAAEVVDAGYGH
jgi:hypothetical protein